jgi:transcriptional regulator with XRE-family HTH domain
MNGELVLKRLQEMGISDERFAADIGCSIGTVQNMKRSRGVRVETALKAANYLGLQLTELIAGVSKPRTKRKSA